MPTIIAFVTAASKKWGNSIGGVLASLPWVAGPIIFFIAIEQGKKFAANSIPGVMVGIIGWLIFCIVYILIGKKLNAFWSILGGYLAYLVFGLLLNPYIGTLNIYQWLLLCFILLTLGLIFFPEVNKNEVYTTKKLRFEIPLRMLMITAFVICITFFAEKLGPSWSGILTPFPIMTAVLAVFTHYTQGIYQVRKIYMGLYTGIFGFCVFLFLQAILLEKYGIPFSFAFGIIANILLTILFKFLFTKYKII
jgi:hypothetical protein